MIYDYLFHVQRFFMINSFLRNFDWHIIHFLFSIVSIFGFWLFLIRKILCLQMNFLIWITRLYQSWVTYQYLIILFWDLIYLFICYFLRISFKILNLIASMIIRFHIFRNFFIQIIHSINLFFKKSNIFILFQFFS